MVTQLQPDVRAYLHGGEVIKRYIRVEEVAHEYGFSVEETEYIAKAASSLYKLTRIHLVKKERFDEFMKGAFTMAKVFITLTGTKHYFGNDFLEKGTKIRLEKEPNNEYDKEAIKVTYEGLGKIGYVANSSYTVIGESMSAGRLYDKIGDVAYAKVILATPAGTICKICKKSLVKDEEQ